ncbi:MAG: hypothetical protein KIT84_23210 [Labilithrix sp.]|nr:hypothetical protein [Labilithrix sp.]MCW5813956.1 hypothetical protein [Labilithrix sp.]
MFEIDGDRFPCASARIGFRREGPGERWEMALVIDTEPIEEDADSPKLELMRLRLDVADWTELAGTRLRVRDPVADDDHDQNVYWGPHFENVTALELAFGPLEDGAIEVEAQGSAYRAVLGTDTETLIPFRVRARCEVVLPPAEAPTATPPLGRKTCRACAAVSFEQVLACPACGAAGWWNPQDSG